MLDTILFALLAIFFWSSSLTGLIGSYRKKFKFPPGPALSSGVILYSGKKARFWGIIFFIGFIIPALGLTFFVISDVKNIYLKVIVIFVILLSSLGWMIFEQYLWRHTGSRRK